EYSHPLAIPVFLNFAFRSQGAGLPLHCHEDRISVHQDKVRWNNSLSCHVAAGVWMIMTIFSLLKTIGWLFYR
uniref:Uncharacterized protein n=1 Tax=Amphimedon queenslandica TaxID=400682 RepID=A0A1X7TX85_AMPQE